MAPSPLACLVVISAATVAAAQTSVSLPQATSSALERNVTVLAAQAELNAARARLVGSELLLQANPAASVQPAFHFGVPTSGNDFQAQLTQRVELFGQRGARIDTALGEVRAAEARLRARQVEVAADVRVAFGALLGAIRQREISSEAVKLARESLAAAEARVAAGAASQIEVNTSRIEVGRTARDLARAEQRVQRARADLAVLMGKSSVEAEGDLSALTPSAELPRAEVDKAISERPELAAALADLDAARAEQRLAAREALPSPTIGVGYNVEEGAPSIQGVLSLELPVFNRNQAARGVAEARAAQAERAAEALRRSIAVEVEVALARLARARDAEKVFGAQTLAAIQENLELATQAYRSGKISFLELLVIRRETLDGRRGYVETLEELNEAQAQLNRALGRIQ